MPEWGGGGEEKHLCFQGQIFSFNKIWKMSHLLDHCQHMTQGALPCLGISQKAATECPWSHCQNRDITPGSKSTGEVKDETNHFRCLFPQTAQTDGLLQ